MAFRRSLSAGKSQGIFKRGASWTQRKNMAPPVMRGGIRL